MLRDTRSCSVRPANIMMACMMHIAKEHFPMEKMNVYASSVEIRDRLFEQIIQLPVTVVSAEDTGFEISPLHSVKRLG